LLDKFFNPSSVAVIGAARDPGKVGHSILSNLKSNGYTGALYPVNPNARTILGLKSYPGVLSIPGPVDLAVIAVPSKFVVDAVGDCGKKGVPAAIVITAGFKETGEEGQALEQRLLEVAAANRVRILGPNCLGLINTANGLNASFASLMPKKGSIAFFSQSGALCTAILDWSLVRGVGFSKFISLGNKSDISELDLLKYLADDPQTRVILGYIEGISDGRGFMEKASKAVRKKPMVVMKGGGTAAGARAASSHTGSLAGSEKAFDAAFRQTGVLRAHTIEDLFNFALAFADNPIPSGPNLCIVTNAGGPGIIAADACEHSSAKMAELSSSTVSALRKSLPPTAGFYNPVDVIGDAKADRYASAMTTVLADPGVDGCLVILTPQAMTEVEATAKAVLDLKWRKTKPVLTCFMGGNSIKNGVALLQDGGLPTYPYPEDGIRAFDALVRYCEAKERPEPSFKHFAVDMERVRGVISSARDARKRELGEKDAREIISAYGFRVPRNVLARTSAEAVSAASEIGFPVVMKIASPDILHKTDIGGVRIGLRTAREVETAFLEITSNAHRLMPSAMVLGCMVQEMVTGGKEVILGMTLDHQFGPMIMFGMGGIYVEALGDVSFRIAPVGVEEAVSMMEETRSFRLLKGLRGEKPSDLGAARDYVLRLSQLVTDFPEIVELDINPLLVLPEGEGAVAIDARVVLA
jgi:acetate---CoA ligase (ADP-forming)